MNILIIRNYPSYMDVLHNTYNIQEVGLAKALIRKGHNCDIVFWTDKDETDVDINVGEHGVIHVYYRHGKTRLKNTVFTGCEVIFEKYDVLQIMEYNQIMSWIMAKKYKDNMVIYHGPYYSSFNKKYNVMCAAFDLFFLSRYKKLNTKFLVKSNLAKTYLVNKGIDEKNISVIGVGVDTEMLVTNKLNNEISIISKMLKDNSFKLLYIGKFEKRRNILFLLEVFSLFHSKHPNSTLYMIGDGKKDYINVVFDKIDELNLQDSIVYEKKLEQKYLSSVYKLSDVFLLPTFYEIFGMVLLEAMFYENIVLTTNNGGSEMLINSGTNGYVIDNFDKEKWVDILDDLIENDELRHSIVTNANDTIKNNFTWDLLADKFISAYKMKLLS